MAHDAEMIYKFYKEETDETTFVVKYWLYPDDSQIENEDFYDECLDLLLDGFLQYSTQLVIIPVQDENE